MNVMTKIARTYRLSSQAIAHLARAAELTAANHTTVIEIALKLYLSVIESYIAAEQGADFTPLSKLKKKR